MILLRKKRDLEKLKKRTQGAISLFLVVTLVPFLSVAAILLETNRYNSAISILDELMGSASLSTLAHYDDFLHDRFGLLAVSQERPLDLLYASYVEQNSKILGESLQLEDVTAEGRYALDSSELLNHQIMEFSAFQAPTTLAVEALNLDSLVAQLEKLTKLENIFKIITSSTNVLNSTKTLYESMEKFVEKEQEFERKKTEYNNAYTALDTAVKNLAEAMDEPRPGDDNAEAQADYDGQIETLQGKVKTARDSYLTVQTSIKTLMESYKTFLKQNEAAVSSIVSEFNSLTAQAGDLSAVTKELEEKRKDLAGTISSLDEYEKSYNTGSSEYQVGLNYKASLESRIAELETQKNMYTASQKTVAAVLDGYEDTVGAYTVEKLDEYIYDFSIQYNRVETDFRSYPFFMTEENYESYLNGLQSSQYHFAVVGGYLTESDLKAYYDSQMNSIVDGAFSSLLDGLKSFYEAIFNMKGIYDPDLSAVIDVDYYNDVVGGLPGGDTSENWVVKIVKSIGEVIDAGSRLKDEFIGDSLWDTLKSWMNPFTKLINIIKAIIDLVDKIVKLFDSIVQAVKTIVNNIVTLFTGYERAYLGTYSVYNMPCRTDGNSFTAMTGKKFTGLLQQSSGKADHDVDDLSMLINSVNDLKDQTGGDLTFRGAELEYILFGSNSEVSNQMFVFAALYLFRLLMDAIPVLTDPTVQSLAAAATLGYPIVLALIVFLEPLADAILLVNGGEVSLYKATPYLSPRGFPSFIKKLTGLNLKIDDKAKEGLANAFGATGDDYNYQAWLNADAIANASTFEIMPMSYRDHCLILLFIIVTQEEQLARIQNIVQMEALYHYQGTIVHPFKLTEAYAFISTDVEVKVKNFMPLPSLSVDTLFRASRNQVRGY